MRFGGEIPFNGSEIPITGVMMAIRWLEVPSKVNSKQASPMNKKNESTRDNLQDTEFLMVLKKIWARKTLMFGANMTAGAYDLARKKLLNYSRL